MRERIRKLLASILIVAIVVGSVTNGTTKQVQAAVNQVKSTTNYLNSSKKYLYLGEQGTKTYNFNIKKEEQKKGATYSWYVKTDKGNPDSVTIHKKTGIVTAKEAGTAYIRCKITLADGTILRPEARVTVRNNITKVKINNLPVSSTITPGVKYDFNRTVLDTDAGKKAKTQGITRWEVKEDTAGVKAATSKGVVLPKKEGKFTIRAVCFQSKAKYKLWLADKKSNKKYITAKSEWVTLYVTSSKNIASASTQEQLNKLLKDDRFTQITLSTEKALEFTIPKGDYSKKVLIVNAANADMKNYGKFKEITINAIKDSTWNEFSKGNIFYLQDDTTGFIVDKDATIKQIVINKANSQLNIDVKGIVSEIRVLQPSTINITGSSTRIPVTVEQTAGGSKITSGVSLKLELKASADITLNQGAEDTTIDKSESKVVVKIENNTKKIFIITTNHSGGEVIGEGKTVISDGASAITNPTDSQDTPSDNNTFYTVTYDSNGGVAIDAILIEEGKSLTSLPTPHKNNSIFLGWYTDSGYQNKFTEDSTVNSNLTLYAKYSEIEVEQENLNDSYTLMDQNPELAFTIISTDASLDASAVKGALALNVADGSEAVELIVNESNGTFLVTAQEGFTEGASYTLTLTDSKLSFKDKETSIRKCSFTIAKEEVYHIELNDDIVYIPDSSVKNMTKDGASVESLSVAVVDLTESGNSDVITNGTFTYTGNTTLYSGDILCIYSGDKPEVPTGNADDATYLDDEIAYVKIVTVTGSTNSQMVRYSDVEEEEVIFLPDVLPISLVDNTELNYTAATVDSDGSFTEELSNLNFSSYSEMGLSEDTTVDVGDYLAFYTGTLSDASSADSVVYARVTGVTDNNGSVTVTFSATTVEEMQEVLDYYSENDVDGDELLDGIDIAVVEKEVEQQVLESGFAEDASAYLTALAVETDGFKKMVGDDFELESLSAKMDDGSSVNLNEISLMAVPSKLSIRNLKVKASIGTKLNKISGKGVRCAVAASFDVPVQTKDGDYIVISLSATFVEEVKISVNASGHPVWKKSIIPHITDYSMNANIDVYNFTGISFQAIVTSKQGGSFDISKEIQKLLSNSNSEQISAGVQNLFEIYSDMMDNDVDWIEIFKQNIVTSNVSVLFGIIQIRTTVDFVVSGEINMALGCNFEYKSGTRYCFWAKLRARKAGSNTIDLIDEVYSFQFYVMGSLGLRAGIKLEFAVGLLSVNLDSVGLTAEAGVYTRLYGYFYYNLESINKLKTSSKSGALLLDFGIYLEIAFKAQVLNGKYQYNPMLYKHEWPLLSVGSRYNVYDFAYDDPKNTIKMKDTVRYILPDDRFNMTCLDLRKGGISTKRYDANHFWTTFSNRNFRLLDGNIVMVNVPKGTRKMECDMTVTWRSTSLAFSSLPITRSFHLVWDNINDNGYTISYNSMGGSVVSSVTQRYETTVTAPIAPRKAGYTFSGWYSDEKLTTRYIFSTMPGENIVLYAKWTAKTDTSYQVEHYQQNVANDNYTLYETETLSGITDTPAKVTAKAYTGFTYSDTKETISAGIIEGEGSLVLKLYYDRNGYILNFKPQNGGDDIVTTMKYGADISAPALVKSGYSFYGWDTAVDATMPAANATYTAQWVINSYTIDFITNGGNDVDSITQAYGTTLFEPAKPTKEGYLFAGWYRDRSLTKHYSISTMPAENITLYAKWYSIPNTAYKVEYYQQNVLDEEYTLKGTENLLGTLGTTVTATAKIYEGFTFNNSASNTVSSGLLTADGNLTLKLYYDRNTYTITFDSNEGSNVEAMNQKYGTTVSAPENPTKSGYIFGGWLRNKALTEAYTFSTMPAENITLYAKWNLSTGTAYKVEHYQQNILDEEYTLKETENLTGKLGTTVTATAKTYEGFTFNSNASKTVSSGILTADGNLTLKLYYDRITYTEYKVEHYQQNVGSSGFSLVETETFTGITGSTVTAEAKKYEGFNFFEFEQDTVSSGILVAGENLTLKLYYRRNYCTINYVSVGQTELFSRVTMYNSIADRPQDPTRLNFIFEGWYIDSSFTTPYNFDTLVTEDITLIAKWKMDGTDAKYMLWIGGVQVTTDNMNSVTGSAITGTISYEPESSTLTLNNATITGYYGENDIYAIYDGQSDSSLTINVIGTNVINMPSDTSRMRQSGIYEYNSLTIGGDSTASLVITAGAADELSAGLAVKDTATIKGGVAVTATGGEIVATDSAIFSTGFWATGSTSTIIITDDSVLRMYGGNAETSIGYRNNYGYQSGVLSVSNGGKIIAAGNTKAMDGMIFVPAQVYTGQSLDGNDKTIFSGDMSGNWCDDIKYVEATN